VLLRGEGKSTTSSVSLSISHAVKPAEEKQPLHDGDAVTVTLGGGLIGWVCEEDEEGGAVKWMTPFISPPSPSRDSEGDNEAEDSPQPLTTFLIEVVSGAEDNDICLGSVIRLRTQSDHFLGVSSASPPPSPEDQNNTTESSSIDLQVGRYLILTPEGEAAALISVKSLLYTIRSPVRPQLLGNDSSGSRVDRTPNTSTFLSPRYDGPEEEIYFVEGELGLTIKRTPTGKACIIRIVPHTQAEHNGTQAGDIIRVSLGVLLLTTTQWL